MRVEFETQDLLTTTEAMAALGITRVTLYRWMKRGKIHTLRFGGYRAIPKSEVERLKGN